MYVSFKMQLPTQIRYAIGGKRVTCRGSKLKTLEAIGRTQFTDSLGKQNLNFLLSRDQVVLLETTSNFSVRRRNANDFSAVFYSIFEFGGITKRSF